MSNEGEVVAIEMTQDFEGHPVRVLGTAEEPLFVAADVCRVLGIKNSRDAIQRLDDDEKGVASTDTPGGRQDVQVVTEAGFYRLVGSARVRGSRAETIGRFQRWVAHDVLVPLRKRGFVADVKGVLHPSAGPQLVEPAATAALAFVERCYSLLERIGMADDRSRFMAADILHNVMSRALPGRTSAEPEAAPQVEQAAQPKTVAQICLEQGATDRDVCLSQVGRLAAKLFEAKYGHAPTLKITQAIGGRPTPVTVYAEADWPIVVEALRQRREIEAARAE